MPYSARNLVNLLLSFCRNYQYGGGDNHKGVKDLLRMESDDSDSELDIETSTTPDNLSTADSGSVSGSGNPAKENSLAVKPEMASPNAVSLSGSLGGGGGGEPPIVASGGGGSFSPTANAAAASRLFSHSHAAAMAAAAAQNLAAKNWLKPELHSFFMPPFSAAAHLANLPFPHHFNSQASLFHVKDSV